MHRTIVCCLASMVLATGICAQNLEIAYDDGAHMFSTTLHAPQRGGILFQPPPSVFPFRLLSVRIWFSTPGAFEIHVLTDTHIGFHDGYDQVIPFVYNALQVDDWDTVDFQWDNIILSEDFVFAGQWTSDVPKIWGDGSGTGHFWRDNGLGWFEYFAMDPLIRATIETNTGVQMELPPAALADGFRLDSVYPNPWNSEARVRIQIQRPQNVSLQLIDLAGRRVAALWEGSMSAGIHDIRVDGNNLASGIYFLTAHGSMGGTASARCILIK
jgi:hypothetical protein